MGTKELRNRDNWQTDSGKKAEKAENNFLKAFTREFSQPEKYQQWLYCGSKTERIEKHL